MSNDPILMHTRWTITAGLVLLTAAAVAWAPRLTPAEVAKPAGIEATEASRPSYCLRVGKLECCVAEEEAAGESATSGELEALGYLE